jgi:hypothetical protein
LSDDIEFLIADGIVFDELNEQLYATCRKVYKTDITPITKEYYDILFAKLPGTTNFS